MDTPVTGTLRWQDGQPINFILNIAGPDGTFWLAEGQFKQQDTGTPAWYLPVGTLGFPPEAWYAATWHDLTGVKNGGYKHTGVDWNLDRSPWGDVDRGEPVVAVTSGTVDAIGFTEKNLRSVVIQVEHQGEPLWVRYWHLAKASADDILDIGEVIFAGDVLGYLGDYRAGGDHLHFDMALDPIPPGAWLTPGIRWVDPIVVLKAHLDPDYVDLSTGRGDG